MKQRSESKKREDALRNKPSAMMSSIEYANAALWLIAGDLYSQAIVSIFSAIENVVKADLKANNSSLDVDKLSASRAIEMANDLHPDLFTSQERERLTQFRHQRNDIVHGGKQFFKNGIYCKDLVLNGIPFYIRYLSAVFGIGYWDVADIDVGREIDVAQQTCKLLESNNEDPDPYIFITARHKLLYSKVQWPQPTDGALGLDEGGREDALVGNAEYYLRNEWGRSMVRISCRICHNHLAFVKTIEDTESIKPHWSGKIPVELCCPICGLEIGPQYRYLVECHIQEWTSDDDCW